MTNALTQRAHQTPLSRDRITARYRKFGPPTELPELNCWSVEKHAGHLASCNSLTDFRRKSALGRPAQLLKLKFSVVPVDNQIRTYWWCSPPRIGRQRICPARSTARENGASFSKERCVRVPLYNNV